ncbi:hypothetical protein N7509_000512 [Penicillium cosmopolitanum]|uniref:Lysine-specific metallo-endopeptidase domain-containing protein n=1 Tax=Penicillium cosmopolitanum TaxID=1131564 RepID=A0A9X0BE94_9EURO|nr:uncharacterized protein N7509_000512 [Penicillium cosmopolitanum]KAJ5413885.1 hypothetical protein N7509_000512 [Penicillium cosmopolitanum]
MSSITVKILAFWLFYIPFAFSAEIGDVFNVKQGSENGGCDSHLSVLTQWWTESQAMASAGISAFDDAKGNADETKTKNAKHALEKYLGINDDTDDADVDDIKLLLEEVQWFMAKKSPDSKDTPWLFCDSSWLEPKPRTLRIEECGEEVEIQDSQQYGSQLQEAGSVPYWSSDLKEYIIGHAYGEGGLCGASGELGVTQGTTASRTVTLCPRAFTRTDVQTDFGVDAQGKKLSDVLSKSATLFHELFHLVIGNDDTIDATYKLGTIFKSVAKGYAVPAKSEWDGQANALKNSDRKTNAQLVRTNPETWVFFCADYWYTLHKNLYWDTTGVSKTA